MLERTTLQRSPTDTDRSIDLSWVARLMRDHYNARDWREANELALLALMDIQEHWGYCSENAASVVADHLGIELQRVFALLTFYADLRTTPRAANVIIACDGAACHTLGSGEVVDALYERLGITAKGQTNAAGTITMELWSGCMGACQLGPLASVDGQYIGSLNREKAGEIVANLERNVNAGGHDPATSTEGEFHGRS